jgi:hypothetical protein
MSESGIKSHQKRLLIVASLVFVAWFVPVMQLFTLPLQFLYTHLHEIGHAIAAMITGGSGIWITVHADGSGLTSSWGGSQLVMSPAGYVGATAMGAGVLALSRTKEGARDAIVGLFIVLLAGLVLWVRGDVVGITTAVGLIGVLFVLARQSWVQDVAQFIGLYMCAASVQAVMQTMNLNPLAYQQNDAQILQEATGIPAIVSAFVWTGISFALAWLGLRRAWSR